MNLVTMRDVSVAYDGYEAIQHVDLEIGDDDFLGVIGPNGGGKTTLVKAILGTVPHTGEICLAPELFRGKERLIGYMPQLSDFDREFPISVLEVVLSGLQGRRGFRSPYTREDREKAMALLASSGIAETARQPIGEVSGGQMQRALLARAVISDPKLLILDEPANFVDNKFEKELYRTLHELNTRMAIVMVSHDIGHDHECRERDRLCQPPRAPSPFERADRRAAAQLRLPYSARFARPHSPHRAGAPPGGRMLRPRFCPITTTATMVIQPGALGRRMPPCGVIRLYLSRSARRHNCLCRTTNTVRRYSG